MLDSPTSTNLIEYNVSEISSVIKKTIDANFSYVKIRGEISGFKAATSGHIYFSLKDDRAVLAAVCWRAKYDSLNIKLEDGLDVVCYGSITTFAGQSRYQLVVDKIELAGIGALMVKLEQLKQKLLAEGLFDNKYKKSIPKYPENIGVITSPTGAVIKDIIHRISDRYPVDILIFPVLVQGDKCAEQVTQAINDANNLKGTKLDVLIIARGGGSFEDLFPFNDEKLVRAAFSSHIPIISAIGHETDFTLLDYVADLRAPTPTGAAELATPNKIDVKQNLNSLDKNIFNLVLGRISNLNGYLLNLFIKIPHPIKYLQELISRYKKNEYNLSYYFNKIIEQKSIEYNKIASRLNFHLLESNIALNQEKLIKLSQSIEALVNKNLETSSAKLDYLNKVLAANNYKKAFIDLNNEKLKQLDQKIQVLIKNKVKEQESKLDYLNNILSSMDYKRVLNRGYAVIKHDKEIITSIQKVSPEQKLLIELSDGVIEVTVNKILQ